LFDVYDFSVVDADVLVKSFLEEQATLFLMPRRTLGLTRRWTKERVARDYAAVTSSFCFFSMIAAETAAVVSTSSIFCGDGLLLLSSYVMCMVLYCTIASHFIFCGWRFGVPRHMTKLVLHLIT
jgi:hypothetical protein